MNVLTAAKAYAALAGAVITALLGTVPPQTTLWHVLTVAAAILTAVATYAVPNKPKVVRNMRGDIDAALLLLVLTFVGVLLLLFRVHFR